MSITINQSDSTSFICEAFGIPIPSIQWFFNDSNMVLVNSTNIVISDFVMTNDSGLDVRVSVIEIVDSVRSSHEGEFTCIASNGVNNSINTPEMGAALLIVQGKYDMQRKKWDKFSSYTFTTLLSLQIQCHLLWRMSQLMVIRLEL